MYRVVIAEDEDIIRKGLVYSIPWADMGCTVVGEAANGVEGVALIQRLEPDIVVADINMPILGIAIIGTAAALVTYQNATAKLAAGTAQGGDDDYDE